MRTRRRDGLVFVYATLILSGCGGLDETAPGPRVASGAPVVLISVDTLRSDRLPAYGYDAVETPAIDRLREDGALFTRAYSHVPLTLPAHASLLSGLLPQQHGVRDNLGYRFDGDTLPSLPRALAEKGYATGAAVSAFVLRRTTGIEAGFETYDDAIELTELTEMGGLQRPGGETLAAILPWLERVSGRPFFLFLHLYEPHTPYEAPAPFRSRYPSAYDAEIAAADAVVGQLLAELDRLGVYDRSLIVLLSDHGEGLGDHGEPEHGILLYREAIQIPLLLKLPRGDRGGSTISVPAQLIDLFPTILDALGEPIPDELTGRSLLTSGEVPDRPIYIETYYPRLHFGWSELHSLVDGRYQLIDGPEPELYDLEADPGQQRNIVREEGGVYLRLRDELERYLTELAPPAEENADVRAQLRALGYLGGAGTRVDGPLPSPRDRLPVIEDLRMAYRHYTAGDFLEAEASFRSVLGREERLVDAWEHLGHCLRQQGRREEAWEAYRQALAISGGAPNVALSAATVLLELGRLEEARRHAELALPAHVRAHAILARIAIDQGALEAAATHAEAALESPWLKRERVLLLLAEVRIAGERFEEALELTGQVEAEIAPEPGDPPPSLHFLRGRALASLGRGDEAEAAFNREMELFPETLGAYSHLALLYALVGREGEVGGVLRRMVESNPGPAANAEAVRTLRFLGDPESAGRLLRQSLRQWPDDPALERLRETG